jgi:FkbM family methyltransferase
MNLTEFKKNINNIELTIFDFASSHSSFGTDCTLKNDDYKFNSIIFEDNDNFIDIGANTGLISFYIAKKFPNVNIHMFECNNFILDGLYLSKLINNTKNIQINGFGISNNSCVKELNIQLDNSGGSSFNKIESENNIKQNVFLFDFEEAMSTYKNIRYMKMDIEGEEFKIFNKLINSNSNIFEKVNYLCLELHKINDKYNEEKNKILKYLNKFKNLELILIE